MFNLVLFRHETESMLRNSRKPRPSSANDALSHSKFENNPLKRLDQTTSPQKYRGIAQRLLRDPSYSSLSPERKQGRSKSPPPNKTGTTGQNMEESGATRKSRRDLPSEEGNVSLSLNEGEVSRFITFANPTHTLLPSFKNRNMPLFHLLRELQF